MFITTPYHITFLLVKAKPSLSTWAGMIITAFPWLGHEKQKEGIKEAVRQRALLGSLNSEGNGRGRDREDSVRCRGADITGSYISH